MEEIGRKSVHLFSCNLMHATPFHPAPRKIALFDDVLTDGAYFKATQAVLKKRYPGIITTGVLIARRVYTNTEEVDEELV